MSLDAPCESRHGSGETPARRLWRSAPATSCSCEILTRSAGSTSPRATAWRPFRGHAAALPPACCRQQQSFHRRHSVPVCQVVCGADPSPSFFCPAEKDQLWDQNTASQTTPGGLKPCFRSTASWKQPRPGRVGLAARGAQSYDTALHTTWARGSEGGKDARTRDSGQSASKL